MKPEEFATALQRKFSSFGGKIIYDQTERGEDFCELVYQNKCQPDKPITVTVYDDGALVSFGSMQNITGDRKISLDAAIQAINDIISDKIIFIFCYENSEKKDDGRLHDSYVFALTGDGSDMSREYEKFIASIKKPLGKIGRLFTPLKGIFAVTNFSGSVCFEIER